MRHSLIAVAIAFTLAACNQSPTSNLDSAQSGDTPSAQSTTASAASSTSKNTENVSMSITGAGASFPQPIYAKWSDAYNKATGGQVNYQSIGSSGGIKQIEAKTVDFEIGRASCRERV